LTEFWTFAVSRNNLSVFCGLFDANFNGLNTYAYHIYIEKEHKHECCISFGLRTVFEDTFS